MNAHIIEQIITAIAAAMGTTGFWALLQSKAQKHTASERMLLGIGHTEIVFFAERYLRRNGITMTELNDLEQYLYKPYKDLGGNGSAEEIVKKCKALPIISEAEADRLDALFRKGELTKK